MPDHATSAHCDADAFNGIPDHATSAHSNADAFSGIPVHATNAHVDANALNGMPDHATSAHSDADAFNGIPDHATNAHADAFNYIPENKRKELGVLVSEDGTLALDASTDIDDNAGSYGVADMNARALLRDNT